MSLCGTRACGRGPFTAPLCFVCAAAVAPRDAGGRVWNPCFRSPVIGGVFCSAKKTCNGWGLGPAGPSGCVHACTGRRCSGACTTGACLRKCIRTTEAAAEVATEAATIQDAGRPTATPTRTLGKHPQVKWEVGKGGPARTKISKWQAARPALHPRLAPRCRPPGVLAVTRVGCVGCVYVPPNAECWWW